MKAIGKYDSLVWKAIYAKSNITGKIVTFCERNYSHTKHQRFSLSRLLQPTNVVPHAIGSNLKTPELASAKQKIVKANTGNDFVLDICKSNKLLVDNGLVKLAYPGNFVYLPLGLRVLEKLTKLLDDCMFDVGGQKILLPTLTEGHLWKTTGRYEKMKGELLSTIDRHKRLLVFR